VKAGGTFEARGGGTGGLDYDRLVSIASSTIVIGSSLRARQALATRREDMDETRSYSVGSVSLKLCSLAPHSMRVTNHLLSEES